MQELWQRGLSWDEEISPDLKKKWTMLFKEMAALEKVQFQRCLTPTGAINNPELITFCDASRMAFGACSYIRWQLADGKFGVRFVAAKSRVAPLKELTIPRLELQAAVLASRLAKSILEEYCNDDQESLLCKITDLKESSPSTKFFLQTQEGEPNYFGGSVHTNESKNFLFVHQEEWQQKLLLKYGSDLALLDATYKTTKYAMPLFFLCVNTNVGYKVVAEFMCQHEDEISISEALGILREWNPDWSPKYFMVDFSVAEIGAIETCFPGVVAYICDFHRQQAIQCWVKAAKNGLDLNEQEFL